MSEECEVEKFRIEKVAGDATKDSMLSKSIGELTSETHAPTLRLRE